METKVFKKRVRRKVIKHGRSFLPKTSPTRPPSKDDSNDVTKLLIDQNRDIINHLLDKDKSEPHEDISLTVDATDQPTISIPTGRGEIKINIQSKIARTLLGIAVAVAIVVTVLAFFKII